jgi:hypothetical protein
MNLVLSASQFFKCLVENFRKIRRKINAMCVQYFQHNAFFCASILSVFVVLNQTSLINNVNRQQEKRTYIDVIRNLIGIKNTHCFLREIIAVGA